MLSKAPPVPESLKQASEEQPTGNEAEAEESENVGNSSNSEEPVNAEVNRIEEPQVARQDASPPVIHREVRQVRTGISSQQVQYKPATRAQRPADDRLFTWAAVGLTIAIVFLLLKKLMKSTGYGAFFMSES